MKHFFVCLSVFFFASFVSAAEFEIGSGDNWAAKIASASTGDTIKVHAGAPAPDAVVVDKLLHFVNFPNEAPVLDAAGAAARGLRFADVANGSSVAGLTFKGYTTFALERYWATPTVTISNCVFGDCGWTLGVTVAASNCEFKNASKGAYDVPNSSYTDCSFSNLSSHGIAGCDGVQVTRTTFTNVAYALVWGENVALTDVTIDGASCGTASVNNITGSNVTFKNSMFGICGGSDVSITGLNIQNVTYAAYAVSGGSLTNVTQTGSGSYILGYSDNVTLDNVQCQGLSYIVSGGDNVTVSNSTATNMVYGFAGGNNLTTANVKLDGGSMAYCGCANLAATRNVIRNYTSGPGECFYASDGDVTSSTFVGNSIVRAWLSADLNFDSCIATGNGIVSHGDRSGTASYCLMQVDGTSIELGAGNKIGYLTRFIDQAGGDYHLLPNSPAIDAGNPDLAVPLTGGARIDIGAFEYDSSADAATPPTIAITTSNSSIFSPAFVEGTVSLDAKTVTWTTGGAPASANLSTAGTFWMNVPLNPAAEKDLSVTASDGPNETSASQSITWTPTDLSGKHASSDVVKIRKNDALLLTASGTGTTLTIDADGDGSVDFTGAPGGTFAFQYSASGTFTAEAKIDGVSAGALLVEVISINLANPIACEVSYQREKNVVITPATQAASVAFTSNDVSLMQVSIKGPFSNEDGEGTTIYLKPLSRGTPIILARLGSIVGPVISFKEVDEFTLDRPALLSAVVNKNTRIGGTPLIIRPYLANIEFNLSMFGHSTTFAGGVTSIAINTSDVKPNGEPLFTQELDEATDEIRGTALIELEVPVGETMYCFSLSGAQSSSQKKQITNDYSNNGHVCSLDISYLTLCAGARKCEGDEGTLFLDIDDGNGEGLAAR